MEKKGPPGYQETSQVTGEPAVVKAGAEDPMEDNGVLTSDRLVITP